MVATNGDDSPGVVPVVDSTVPPLVASSFNIASTVATPGNANGYSCNDVVHESNLINHNHGDIDLGDYDNTTDDNIENANTDNDVIGDSKNSLIMATQGVTSSPITASPTNNSTPSPDLILSSPSGGMVSPLTTLVSEIEPTTLSESIYETNIEDDKEKEKENYLESKLDHRNIDNNDDNDDDDNDNDDDADNDADADDDESVILSTASDNTDSSDSSDCSGLSDPSALIISSKSHSNSTSSSASPTSIGYASGASGTSTPQFCRSLSSSNSNRNSITISPSSLFSPSSDSSSPCRKALSREIQMKLKLHEENINHFVSEMNNSKRSILKKKKKKKMNEGKNKDKGKSNMKDSNDTGSRNRIELNRNSARARVINEIMGGDTSNISKNNEHRYERSLMEGENLSPFLASDNYKVTSNTSNIPFSGSGASTTTSSHIPFNGSGGGSIDTGVIKTPTLVDGESLSPLIARDTDINITPTPIPNEATTATSVISSAITTGTTGADVQEAEWKAAMFNRRQLAEGKVRLPATTTTFDDNDDSYHEGQRSSIASSFAHVDDDKTHSNSNNDFNDIENEYDLSKQIDPTEERLELSGPPATTTTPSSSITTTPVSDIPKRSHASLLFGDINLDPLPPAPSLDYTPNPNPNPKPNNTTAPSTTENLTTTTVAYEDTVNAPSSSSWSDSLAIEGTAMRLHTPIPTTATATASRNDNNNTDSGNDVVCDTSPMPTQQEIMDKIEHDNEADRKKRVSSMLADLTSKRLQEDKDKRNYKKEINLLVTRRAGICDLISDFLAKKIKNQAKRYKKSLKAHQEASTDSNIEIYPSPVFVIKTARLSLKVFINVMCIPDSISSNFQYAFTKMRRETDVKKNYPYDICECIIRASVFNRTRGSDGQTFASQLCSGIVDKANEYFDDILSSDWKLPAIKLNYKGLKNLILTTPTKPSRNSNNDKKEGASVQLSVSEEDDRVTIGPINVTYKQLGLLNKEVHSREVHEFLLFDHEICRERMWDKLTNKYFLGHENLPDGEGFDTLQLSLVAGVSDTYSSSIIGDKDNHEDDDAMKELYDGTSVIHHTINAHDGDNDDDNDNINDNNNIDAIDQVDNNSERGYDDNKSVKNGNITTANKNGDLTQESLDSISELALNIPDSLVRESEEILTAIEVYIDDEESKSFRDIETSIYSSDRSTAALRPRNAFVLKCKWNGTLDFKLTSATNPDPKLSSIVQRAPKDGSAKLFINCGVHSLIPTFTRPVNHANPFMRSRKIPVFIISGIRDILDKVGQQSSVVDIAFHPSHLLGDYDIMNIVSNNRKAHIRDAFEIISEDPPTWICDYILDHITTSMGIKPIHYSVLKSKSIYKGDRIPISCNTEMLLAHPADALHDYGTGNPPEDTVTSNGNDSIRQLDDGNMNVINNDADNDDSNIISQIENELVRQYSTQIGNYRNSDSKSYCNRDGSTTPSSPASRGDLYSSDKTLFEYGIATTTTTTTTTTTDGDDDGNKREIIYSSFDGFLSGALIDKIKRNSNDVIYGSSSSSNSSSAEKKSRMSVLSLSVTGKKENWERHGFELRDKHLVVYSNDSRGGDAGVGISNFKYCFHICLFDCEITSDKNKKNQGYGKLPEGYSVITITSNVPCYRNSSASSTAEPFFIAVYNDKLNEVMSAITSRVRSVNRMVALPSAKKGFALREGGFLRTLQRKFLTLQSGRLTCHESSIEKRIENKYSFMLAGMTAHKLHEIRHDLKGNSQYFMILRNSSSIDIDNSGKNKNNSNRDSKRKNSVKDSDSNDDNSMVFVNAITGDGINSIPSNKYDSSRHTPSHTPSTSKITTTTTTNSNNISNRSHDSITRSMNIYGDSSLRLDLRLMEGGIVRPQLRMAFYSPELRDEWVDAFRMHIQLANKLYLSKASSV